jgi:hypothetical protein
MSAIRTARNMLVPQAKASIVVQYGFGESQKIKNVKSISMASTLCCSKVLELLAEKPFEHCVF